MTIGRSETSTIPERDQREVLLHDRDVAEDVAGAQAEPDPGHRPRSRCRARTTGYDISAAPATNGTNVRTIGMKRPRTMALPPCRSKNSCARATCAGLIQRPQRGSVGRRWMSARRRPGRRRSSRRRRRTAAISSRTTMMRMSSAPVAAMAPAANSSESPGRNGADDQPRLREDDRGTGARRSTPRSVSTMSSR